VLDQWIAMLADFSPSLWLLAATGVFFTGVTKSGFAGSTGVVAVPIMSLLMDPKLAAGLLLPLLLFMDALNVKAYWGQHRQEMFQSLAIGTLIGIILGALVFKWINPQSLKFCIGILSIIFALNQMAALFGFNYKPKVSTSSPPRPVAPTFGLIAGFTSFIAHAGGAPLTLYFLRANLDKTAILATSAVTIGFMNAIKLPAYAVVGALNIEVGIFSLVLMPLAWLGIKTGLWLKEYISERLFVQIMTYSLLILGSYLVYASL
jgi:uncharacterized membrane protein YfcA